MKRATIWNEGSWYVARVPYHPKFKDRFKALVDPALREWDGIERVWKFDASYLTDVVELLEEYFDVHVIEVLDEEGAVDDPEAVVPTDGDAYSRMLQLAPPEALRKIYRLIAAAIHPDQGGSHEKMVALNTAWDDIQKK